MDTKKVVEYGLIIIVVYFAASWLLGALQSGVQSFGGYRRGYPNVYGTPIAPNTWLYGPYYNAPQTVRYGPPRARGGPDGRRPGTGGY